MTTIMPKKQTSDHPDTESDPADSVIEQQPDVNPPKTQHVDPTRYGDWEKNGRCIDF